MSIPDVSVNPTAVILAAVQTRSSRAGTCSGRVGGTAHLHPDSTTGH